MIAHVFLFDHALQYPLIQIFVIELNAFNFAHNKVEHHRAGFASLRFQ